MTTRKNLPSEPLRKQPAQTGPGHLSTPAKAQNVPRTSGETIEIAQGKEPKPPDPHEKEHHQAEANRGKTPAEKALTLMNEVLLILHEIRASALKNKTERTQIDVATINKLGSNIEQAVESVKATKADDVAAVMERLEKLTAVVYETKETVAMTTRKPYAQAAKDGHDKQEASNERIKEIQHRNEKRKEERRKERAKLQITLTVENDTPETKTAIANETHENITQRCKQAIQNTIKDGSSPTIYGVQKLKSNDLRITCNTIEDAQKLQTVEWQNAYQGLKLKRAKFSILIRGVPTEELDPYQSQTIDLTKLEKQNESQNIKIQEARPLHNKPKATETPARYNAIVISTHDPAAANRCIKHGFYINYCHYTAERYTPHLQVKQCFNCQEHGHIASKCKGETRCAHCSDNHPTTECKSDIKKCAGCEGSHSAYDKQCPRKHEAIQHCSKQRRNARNSQPYFDE